jgi:hypothetical protein
MRRLSDDEIRAEAAKTTPDELAAAFREAIAAVRRIREAMRPEAVRAAISAQMAEVRNRHSVDGLLLAPAEALRRVEAEKRKAYDADLRREAALVRDTLDMLGRVREVKRDTSKTIATQRGEPIARVADLLERDDLRKRVEGRPLAELVRVYQDTPDDLALALVAFIETEHAAGWVSLKPRQGPEDVAAVETLQAAIRERRETRVPAALREIDGLLATGWTDFDRMALDMLISGKAEPALSPSSAPREAEDVPALP